MASSKPSKPGFELSPSARRVFVATLLGAGALVLLFLVLTGRPWRAAAYALVVLFAFLVVESAYFWGAMILGGTIEALLRRRSGRWGLGGESLLDVPEHDIDPGLELMAAGVLVYKLGEIKPRVYFRKVSLANVRAIRPFVIARTGDARPCHFHFALVDEEGRVRYDEEFEFLLTDAPRLVMPRCRLVLAAPHSVVGQRWSLQVYSGVTVVTSFRFMFAEGAGGDALDAAVAAGDSPLSWQQELLPRLLDEAIKHDVMTETREIVLEEQ